LQIIVFCDMRLVRLFLLNSALVLERALISNPI
jgi:hypothetical protein